MKALSTIHLPEGHEIKTPDTIDQLIRKLDRVQPNGTLTVTRLTDHGAPKRCFIARPAILRIEET